MTVSAIATAVNHSLPSSGGNFKPPEFVFIKRPQVILAIEIRIATARLVLVEFSIANLEQTTISFGLNADRLLITRRTISRKRINIYVVFDDLIDQRGNFIDVSARDRRHNDRTNTRAIDADDLFERRIE